jgi:hypothetical protein
MKFRLRHPHLVVWSSYGRHAQDKLHEAYPLLYFLFFEFCIIKSDLAKIMSLPTELSLPDIEARKDKLRLTMSSTARLVCNSSHQDNILTTPNLTIEKLTGYWIDRAAGFHLLVEAGFDRTATSSTALS